MKRRFVLAFVGALIALMPTHGSDRLCVCFPICHRGDAHCFAPVCDGKMGR